VFVGVISWFMLMQLMKQQLSTKFNLVILALLIAIAATRVQSQDKSKVLGDWTGESICADKVAFPACNDEQVIFHIKESAKNADKLTITADKIVSGKPEEMSELDFDYDSKTGTLTCEFTRGRIHGRWEFTVKDDTFEGTLVVLPDKTVARRVKLKRKTDINDRYREQLSGTRTRLLDKPTTGTVPRAVASGIRTRLCAKQQPFIWV
jgi:hypothetical protein